MDQIEAKLADLMAEARRMGATAAEVKTTKGHSDTLEVRNGRLESIVHAEPDGWTLKLWIGNRAASLSTTDLARADEMSRLVERTLIKARLAPGDPLGVLAASDQVGRGSSEADAALALADPVEVEPGRMQEMALAAEAAAITIPGVTKSDGAAFSVSRSTSYHVTSEGFQARVERTGFSLRVRSVAGGDGTMEADSFGRTTRWLVDLPAPEVIGAESGRRAAARVGARRIASGRVPVIFDRRVAMSIVGPFLRAISGTAIARGSSFLKHRLEKTVFSPSVSILDDPLLPRGLGSRVVDGEGVPSQRRTLIDKGVLCGWLLDLSSARQLGLQPNGYGRSGTSNLVVRPGTRSSTAMMRAMGSGLVVTSMFGPSLNEETGDWSAGVSGIWFEGGEPAYPVNELTVAGSLPDMYARLEPADDLAIESAANSPSLLVDALTVAGK